MPSTYSQNLRIELIASGEQGNSWGNTTNNNLGTLIEQAISGYRSLDTGWSSNSITLTAYNGANDQSRNMYLEVPSSVGLTGIGQITAPTSPKVYVIKNTSSGGFAVRIKTGTSTTTCLIPNGQTKTVVCDGSEFTEAVTAADYLTLSGNPVTSLQATTRSYVDTADSQLLKIDGTRNMTGELLLSSTGTPSSSLAAISKGYAATTYLPLTGGTLTGALYLPSTAPSTATQATTKGYVDGLSVIVPSAPITASGTLGTGVTVGVSTATNSTLGVVKAGSNVTIGGDGSINVAASGTGTVQTIGVNTANGFQGTASAGGADPRISIQTSFSANLVKSFGNALTAATASDITTVLGSTAVTNATNATDAVTATRLYTARLIGGVSFDGTTNISLPGVNQAGTQNTSGNAATATAPDAGRGSFITSSNIGSQTVATAGTCTGNAATATAPAGSGSFITSLNIGSQSVSYASSAGTATSATSATTASNATNLGGAPSGSYLLSATAGTTYVAKAGSTMTGTLSISSGFTTNTVRLGVFTDGSGNYYPGISAYRNAGTGNYAPFVIVQENNSEVIVKYLLSTAGQHNFSGNVAVTGNLSCSGTKPFRIDHPIVENKKLYHIAIEAPRADLIYRGVAQLTNGEAVVNIDSESRLTAGTFEAIVDDAEVIGLHNKNSFTRVRASEVVDGNFTIFAEDPTCSDAVAWMVVAERAGSTLRGNSLVDELGHIVPEQDEQEQ